MRTIEINVDEVKITNSDYHRAIGRLATFGNYDVVKIYNDGKGEDLIATYYKEGAQRFVIGAIFREGQYEFHS